MKPMTVLHIDNEIQCWRDRQRMTNQVFETALRELPERGFRQFSQGEAALIGDGRVWLKSLSAEDGKPRVVRCSYPLVKFDPRYPEERDDDHTARDLVEFRALAHAIRCEVASPSGEWRFVELA